MALEPMMPSLDDDENPELRDFRRRFWWTLPLSVTVLALAMFGHRSTFISTDARPWIELALSAPVVLWAGWPFFERWAQSIANRSPNMWTLIGTGVGRGVRLQRRRDRGAGSLSRIVPPARARERLLRSGLRSSYR
jgi:Cu+-exporting ATPase